MGASMHAFPVLRSVVSTCDRVECSCCCSLVQWMAKFGPIKINHKNEPLHKPLISDLCPEIRGLDIKLGTSTMTVGVETWATNRQLS